MFHFSFYFLWLAFRIYSGFLACWCMAFDSQGIWALWHTHLYIIIVVAFLLRYHYMDEERMYRRENDWMDENGPKLGDK